MRSWLGVMLLSMSFLAFTWKVLRLRNESNQSVYFGDLLIMVMAAAFHIWGIIWASEPFRPLTDIHKTWAIFSCGLIALPTAQMVNLFYWQGRTSGYHNHSEARYCLWDCLTGFYTAYLVSIFMWFLYPWWPTSWLVTILVAFAWIVYVRNLRPARRVKDDLVRLRVAWWIIIATGANVMAAIMMITAYGTRIWSQLGGAIPLLISLIWMVLVLRIIFLRQLDYELVGGRLQVARKQLAHSVIPLIFIYTIAASVAVVTLVSV